MADQLKLVGSTGDEPLTLHDQVFVNAMGYLAVAWGEWDRLEMIIAVLEDVLPHVNAEHSRIGPLADIADQMVVAAKRGGALDTRRAAYTQAMDKARVILAGIFCYRAVSGHDRLSQQEVA
ncbi:MAG: hypothetical protein AAFX07_00650 [Pseudomonadota bacterium]